MGRDGDLCDLPIYPADAAPSLADQLARVRACQIANAATVGRCFADKAALVRWIKETARIAAP